MIRSAGLLGLAGLIGATALFIWQGLDPVLTAFAAAGYGIIWVALSHFASMLLNARAWQILLPERNRPSTIFFLWAVWLRESVNGLLPVARVGGEIVTAHLLIKRGLTGSTSVASLIVDVTITLVSQLVFTLIGISFLVTQHNKHAYLQSLVAGIIISLPVIILFFTIQKKGLFSLLLGFSKKLFGDKFEHMVSSATALDLKVRRFYKRRQAVLVCFVWQLAGWIAGAGEIWLSLYVLNHPVPFTNAVITESIIQALSSSAFVVPGALGVQEGGFMIVGGILGLTHETALALALMRRARDITVFVPALAIWQIGLGKKLSASQKLT